MTKMTTCEYCGNDFDDSVEMASNSDYNTICENCLDDFYRCDDCDELVYRDDTYSVDGDDKYICSACASNYSECYECDTLTSEGYHTGDDHTLCPNCADDAYRCADCGTLYADEDYLQYHHSHEEYYCENCWVDEDEINRDRINDYSMKPTAEFYNHTSDTHPNRYLGIELEIQHGGYSHDNASVIQHKYEELYCKYDGSLTAGFEIVSHPCTLEYHENALDWDALTRWLRAQGYDAGKGAGLHIHISRDEFSTEELAKMAYLMNVRFYREMKTFARRRLDDALCWAPKATRLDEYFNQTSHEHIDASEVLYQARRVRGITNFQNDATVEFRIFKSTLSARILLASAQLISNLADIVHDKTFLELSTMPFKDLLTYNEKHDKLITYAKQKFSKLF